jgi:AcrR family transcriptional regulator
VARGQQTRQLLAETLLALVDEGVTAPTARQVAARAGVSVRIVYHHFGGTEGLHAAAVALQAERHRDTLFAIPPRGPPDLRIRALCRQRRLYFEGLAPVYRAAVARADAGAALLGLLAADRTRMRMQLAGTMAPEVASRGSEAGDLLDALEQATGWEAWRALRDTRGRTPAAAERAMAFTAVSLLT